MTLFRLDIGARARQAGRFLGRVRSELLQALSEEKVASGLTQQALAQKLQVHRSVINRQLSGEANLTLRSVADLAWALNREITFELRRPADEAGQNYVAETSTIGTGQARIVGAASTNSSTLPSPQQTQITRPRTATKSA
jgi:ribosome-binding protein aMBF1 (putative translation factor)